MHYFSYTLPARKGSFNTIATRPFRCIVKKFPCPTLLKREKQEKNKSRRTGFGLLSRYLALHINSKHQHKVRQQLPHISSTTTKKRVWVNSAQTMQTIWQPRVSSTPEAVMLGARGNLLSHSMSEVISASR